MTDSVCLICGRPLTIDIQGMPGYKEWAYIGCMNCYLVQYVEVQCAEIFKDESYRKEVFRIWSEAVKHSSIVADWKELYDGQDFDTLDDISICYRTFQRNKLCKRLQKIRGEIND